MIWDKATQTVFFELEVNSDPSLDEVSDTFMLALANESGAAPELFMYIQPLRGCTLDTGKLDPTCASKAIDQSSTSLSIRYAAYTNGAWTTMGSTNPSSKFEVVRPWIDVQGIPKDNPTAYNWTLSFGLKVPVDGASGQIRDALRIYGNLQVLLTSAVVEAPVLCNPSASGECDLVSAGPPQNRVPIGSMQTTWPVLRSDDSGCGGVEVIRELVGSDVGVTNGFVPGTTESYPLPGSVIPRADGARFRAGFHNGTDSIIASGSIEAEFYIANWGAQYASFNDSATWTKLFEEPIPLQGGVSIGGYAGQSGEGSIESPTWVPKDAGLALGPSHQCMFVRLKSNTPGIDFKVDSVYRNMDLVTASVARRPATIDLGNRPLPKGKDEHEVYLLVRTQHMPDPATCDAAKGKLYGCAKGGRLIRERRALTKAQRQGLKADFAAGRTNLDQEQVDALLEQKDRKGVKTEDLPFVVVYAMVDTGRRVDLPGKPKTPVLQQFSEFGYYVEHEGDLEGWETLMHGAEPVPGTNNLFKLEIEPKKAASVANTMRVLSKETKACKTRPNPRLGVVSQQQAEEIESKLLADVGKGDVATMDKARMTDDQLGCDPPPLRMQCRRKDCGEHSPAAFIDGSRYVGDWKGLERRRLRPHKQPDATQPDAKPAAKPKAGG